MRIFWLYGFCVLTACVEPYPLPESNADSQLLIVDGFLNASEKMVRVRLSRSVNLTSLEDSRPEQNAIVLLKNEKGAPISLEELDSGIYEAALASEPNGEYQLEIITGGEKYSSDPVPVLVSPPIDSVSWHATDLGISVDVSTHDPQNKARFYLWQYEETWEYRAAFQSSFIFQNGKFTFRLPEEDIYHCWHQRPSTEILIGTTNRLTEDVISNLSLITIPRRSEKLIQKYSILVRQITISQDAYDFWQQLKKNTESLGTLFDPQPSQLTGNIRNESGTPAIGYFYAGTVSEKRMTVALDDLPREYRFIADIGLCEEDTVLLADLPAFEPKTFNLVVGVYSLFGQLIGFRYSTHYCTDCLLQGGTRTKPEYW